jgi:hypothetical protein
MQKIIIVIPTFILTLFIGVSFVGMLDLFSSHQVQEDNPLLTSVPSFGITSTKSMPKKMKIDSTESDSIKLIPCQDINSLKQPFKLQKRIVLLGVVNGKVYCGTLPEYPITLRNKNISGTVKVLVHVNKEGEIVRAHAETEQLLLRETAERAAFQTRITPIMLGGEPQIASGVLVYQFDAESGVSLVNPLSHKKDFKQSNQ